MAIEEHSLQSDLGEANIEQAHWLATMKLSLESRWEEAGFHAERLAFHRSAGAVVVHNSIKVMAESAPTKMWREDSDIPTPEQTSLFVIRRAGAHLGNHMTWEAVDVAPGLQDWKVINVLRNTNPLARLSDRIDTGLSGVGLRLYRSGIAEARRTLQKDARR